MKYWFDTEFIEDGKTIDLISIGIVAEDGREYYAVSNNFNPKKASEWVLENVLSPMGIGKNGWFGSPDILSPTQKEHWKAQRSRAQIKEDIIKFVYNYPDPAITFEDTVQPNFDKPEFWAYYADYDWVTFCQLFGTMMDLPKGFPMYCRDIKQWCDQLGNPRLPEQGKGEHNALADARWNKQAWEFLKQYEMGSNSPIVIL